MHRDVAGAFGGGLGDPRNRPRFTVAHVPARHRRADQGELFERTRHPQFLAGGPEVDAELEVEPVGAITNAPARPSLAGVELGEQFEEAIVRGVQVSRQLGELAPQPLDVVPLGPSVPAPRCPPLPPAAGSLDSFDSHLPAGSPDACASHREALRTTRWPASMARLSSRSLPTVLRLRPVPLRANGSLSFERPMPWG
jgi:hypothetical protein